MQIVNSRLILLLSKFFSLSVCQYVSLPVCHFLVHLTQLYLTTYIIKPYECFKTKVFRHVFTDRKLLISEKISQSTEGGGLKAFEEQERSLMHYKIGFQEQNALAWLLSDFVYKLVGFWPDHFFSLQKIPKRGQDFLDGLLSYFFKQKIQFS